MSMVALSLVAVAMAVAVATTAHSARGASDLTVLVADDDRAARVELCRALGPHLLPCERELEARLEVIEAARGVRVLFVEAGDRATVAQVRRLSTQALVLLHVPPLADDASTEADAAVRAIAGVLRDAVAAAVTETRCEVVVSANARALLVLATAAAAPVQQLLRVASGAEMAAATGVANSTADACILPHSATLAVRAHLSRTRRMMTALSGDGGRAAPPPRAALHARAAPLRASALHRRMSSFTRRTLNGRGGGGGAWSAYGQYGGYGYQTASATTAPTGVPTQTPTPSPTSTRRRRRQLP